MGNNKNTLALELRSTFLFEQDELSIRNIKDACQKHFGPQMFRVKDLTCMTLKLPQQN